MTRDWRALAAALSTFAGAVAAYLHVRTIGEYVQDIANLDMEELSQKYSWQIPDVCKLPVTLAVDPSPCHPPMSELTLWLAAAAFLLSILLSLQIWTKPKA